MQSNCEAVDHYAANNPVRYVDPDGRSDEDDNILSEEEKKFLIDRLGTQKYEPLDTDILKSLKEKSRWKYADTKERIKEKEKYEQYEQTIKESAMDSCSDRMVDVEKIDVEYLYNTSHEERNARNEPDDPTAWQIGKFIPCIRYAIYLQDSSNGNFHLQIFYYDINGDGWIDFTEELK